MAPGDGAGDELSLPRVEHLATDLEEAIFGQFKQTNPKYKNQVRSRVFNLKDKNNTGLREGLLQVHSSTEKEILKLERIEQREL